MMKHVLLSLLMILNGLWIGKKKEVFFRTRLVDCNRYNDIEDSTEHVLSECKIICRLLFDEIIEYYLIRKFLPWKPMSSCRSISAIYVFLSSRRVGRNYDSVFFSPLAGHSL